VEAILKRKKDYSKGDADFSVTELLRSPRERCLLVRHADELTMDISDELSSWEGNLIHDALEEPNLKRVILVLDLRGKQVIISGKADYLDFENAVIKDFKTTSVWSVIYGSHIQKWTDQINCYDYMYSLYHGTTFKNAFVEAYMTDWQRSKAKFDPTYPACKVLTVPIVLWTREEQHDFLIYRATLHEDATRLQDDLLPLCTGEEMWSEPTKWAMYKGDNKRATKVFDSEEDAQNAASLTKGGRVVRREGARRKCESYCLAAPFCNQWKAYREATTEEESEGIGDAA
jgi:hypothetical protein